MTANVLAALVVFVSGFINSLTGFGFIIVAAPFLVHLLLPKQVAATALVLGLIVSATIACREWKTINARVTLSMAGAALFGIPLGAHVLGRVSQAGLKMLVGATVIGVMLPMLRGFRLPSAAEKPASLFSGFLSGVFSGICGMSGAVAALFFVCYAWKPSQVRPTIAGFNAVVTAVTLTWLTLSGAIGWIEYRLALFFLPAALLGILLSGLLRLRVDHRHFRLLTFLLVLVAGMLALISGLIETIR